MTVLREYVSIGSRDDPSIKLVADACLQNHAKVFDKVWPSKNDRFDFIVKQNNSRCSVERKTDIF